MYLYSIKNVLSSKANIYLIFDLEGICSTCNQYFNITFQTENNEYAWLFTYLLENRCVLENIRKYLNYVLEYLYTNKIIEVKSIESNTYFHQEDWKLPNHTWR